MDLQALEQQATDEINGAGDLRALDEVRVRYLDRKSVV